MMNAISPLKDDAARRDAISCLDRSILVEAGAGSGKTAVMAGRIAIMLAEGIAPCSIAAVTFTELAASELLSRVREFVGELAEGRIPTELKIALPTGLSDAQRVHLHSASATIDEITCTTIHGFCQRLIKPYPAEADIDPGAGIIDRNQGELVFHELVDDYLRERLDGVEGGILADLVLHEPAKTVKLVRDIAERLRRWRSLIPPALIQIDERLAAFIAAAEDFAAFPGSAPAAETETVAIADALAKLAGQVDDGPDHRTPAGLVHLLVARPNEIILTGTGTFRVLNKKGKWQTAAKEAGLSKADGEQLFDTANTHYLACRDSWIGLQQAVAGCALAHLIEEVRPVIDRYRQYKRASALLDFDDLIFAARDLLRDHEDVRQALAKRFAHVLVDEFQDTDPLQTEIFWRLCGDPGGDPADWSRYQIRPGALFLVGDPKQAIYRFRGADVAAYVEARDAFQAQSPDNFLSIATNFRSCRSILTFVNARFEAVLSADGQPGLTPLDHFHEDHDSGISVVALDVAVAGEDGKAKAEQMRDGEADAVADACARLIGNHPVLDKRSGGHRPCRPGDIALLAPTGADLWRYEEALERRGIPVATQAGKGLFRRQEVQDLIAITRVLADRRDTLALGALLRGPLVGLTEEELLDIVWALPTRDDAPERLARLDLNADAAVIAHPLARDIFEKLQVLGRRRNTTTPFELLSEAVDVLRVRPILLARHHGQAERALANVDLYLSLSRTYASRGLRSFAETMATAWADEESAVEGRPDAQEEAVALYTMHAAKGLEWPIVIPINTMTTVMPAQNAVIDRQTGTFYCSVLDVAPEGHEAARDAEKAELERERIRLWYVAATRAREILVLPRLDAQTAKSAWIGLIDLALGDLPALDLAHFSPTVDGAGSGAANSQTREIFAAEAARIAESHVRLAWLAPSRDEGSDSPILQVEAPTIWAAADDDTAADPPALLEVQGGRERGLVLHKLIEEVLTGETLASAEALQRRAGELIVALGRVSNADAADGLSPRELAGCIERTLALPEIAAIRSELLPEFAVYGTREAVEGETAIAGIVDALTIDADGKPRIIVDWKSDVAPNQAMIEHYRQQVSTYLELTGAERGLIVLMTSGKVIMVSR